MNLQILLRDPFMLDKEALVLVNQSQLSAVPRIQLPRRDQTAINWQFLQVIEKISESDGYKILKDNRNGNFYVYKGGLVISPEELDPLPNIDNLNSEEPIVSQTLEHTPIPLWRIIYYRDHYFATPYATGEPLPPVTNERIVTPIPFLTHVFQLDPYTAPEQTATRSQNWVKMKTPQAVPGEYLIPHWYKTEEEQLLIDLAVLPQDPNLYRTSTIKYVVCDYSDYELVQGRVLLIPPEQFHPAIHPLPVFDVNDQSGTENIYLQRTENLKERIGGNFTAVQVVLQMSNSFQIEQIHPITFQLPRLRKGVVSETKYYPVWVILKN